MLGLSAKKLHLQLYSQQCLVFARQDHQSQSSLNHSKLTLLPNEGTVPFSSSKCSLTILCYPLTSTRVRLWVSIQWKKYSKYPGIRLTQEKKKRFSCICIHPQPGSQRDCTSLHLKNSRSITGVKQGAAGGMTTEEGFSPAALGAQGNTTYSILLGLPSRVPLSTSHGNTKV